MKTKKILSLFFAAGLIILFLSIMLFLRKSHLWYFSAGPGMLFIFDYLASPYEKNTALQVFLRNKKKFIKLYLAMILLGVIIEFVGRFILGLWEYPHYNQTYEIASVLFYPFLLFQLREMYVLLKSKIKMSFISLAISAVMGIIIWEVPNLFSKDWIYYLPTISLEIFNLNIIVIFGWTLLILIPFYIYKIVLNIK